MSFMPLGNANVSSLNKIPNHPCQSMPIHAKCLLSYGVTSMKMNGCRGPHNTEEVFCISSIPGFDSQLQSSFSEGISDAVELTNCLE